MCVLALIVRLLIYTSDLHGSVEPFFDKNTTVPTVAEDVNHEQRSLPYWVPRVNVDKEGLGLRLPFFQFPHARVGQEGLGDALVTWNALIRQSTKRHQCSLARVVDDRNPLAKGVGCRCLATSLDIATKSTEKIVIIRKTWCLYSNMACRRRQATLTQDTDQKYGEYHHQNNVSVALTPFQHAASLAAVTDRFERLLEGRRRADDDSLSWAISDVIILL